MQRHCYLSRFCRELWKGQLSFMCNHLTAAPSFFHSASLLCVVIFVLSLICTLFLKLNSTSFIMDSCFNLQGMIEAILTLDGLCTYEKSLVPKLIEIVRRIYSRVTADVNRWNRVVLAVVQFLLNHGKWLLDRSDFVWTFVWVWKVTAHRTRNSTAQSQHWMLNFFIHVAWHSQGHSKACFVDWLNCGKW